MKVMGIILAAGQSRRMGINKLTLPVGEKTMAAIVMETASKSELTTTYVVTSKRNGLDKLGCVAGCSMLFCQDAINGQSFSLICGLEEAEKQGAEAVVVLLADQPFIQAETINKLIHVFQSNTELEFVASRYREVPQPPVLFSRSVFAAMKKLRGDKGAGSLIKGSTRLEKGEYIDYLSPQLLADIDTTDMYKRYCLNEGRSTYAANVYPPN